MMLKVEINNGQFKSEVFVQTPNNGLGTTQNMKELRSFASEFRTYCAVTGKPLNTPHFVNWINKYTAFEMTYAFPATGRIDL